MSNPPKSSSTFSFGTPATSSGGPSLFGSTTSTNNPSSGLFGSSAPNTAASGTSIFGTAGTAPTTSSSSSLFGGATTTSAPSQQPLFGGGAGTGQAGSIFGGQASTGNSGGPKPAGGAWSGFSTPKSKPSDTPSTGAPANTSLFGAAQSSGTGNIFGNQGSSSAPAGSTTPAPSKPAGGFSFSGVSTTPAGPPPSGNAAGPGSSSVFSLNKPVEEKSSIFGASTQPQSSTQTSASTVAPSNLFATAASAGTSNIFGQPKAADTSNPSSSAPSSNPFGGASAASGTSLFGNKQDNTSQPKASFFGGSNVNSGASGGQPSQSGALNSTTLFPKLGEQKPAASATSQAPSTGLFTNTQVPKEAPTTTAPTFSFPMASTSQPSASVAPAPTAPASTAPAPPATASAPPAAPASSAPTATNPFGNLGGQTVTSPTATGQASGPAASSASTTSAAPRATGDAAPSVAPTGTTAVGDTGASTLGASTSGPRPPPQSRLKNKTMDEIITRWAADLSKYQKQFQQDAVKIAEWDRMLVENSEKIQKLYGSTLEAERATVEVERQLSAVENSQQELEGWLDNYEGQVDDMMANLGQGDALQGPDQERERTYNLAERLSERLNEMGKDLTSMIEEINDASSVLSKNNKTDDPLSQIVRVLNGHLSQLQQIDQGAAALQAKVSAAQKASRSMGATNGMNGLGSDAADDFYRSYMGRR